MSSVTYTVSSLQDIRSDKSVQSAMRDVLIALLPAAAAGVYFFKTRALLIILTSILTAAAAEAVWQKVAKQKIRVYDLSAVVTGLLLALNLPATVPLWIPAVGSIFAIIFIKQFFGGLGQNFMNPALAARAFLLASWAIPMTNLNVNTSGTDAVAAASEAAAAPSFWELLKGPVGAYVGEASVLALLIGGAYLIIRRVISLRVPVAYIGTVALLSWILGDGGLMTGDPVSAVLSGGLMLGAFFMATDHSTSPTTSLGQYIMGIGCGIFTTIFRVYGHNSEGFMYAILIMNLFVPFIEKYTTPRVVEEVA